MRYRKELSRLNQDHVERAIKDEPGLTLEEKNRVFPGVLPSDDWSFHHHGFHAFDTAGMDGFRWDGSIPEMSLEDWISAH